MERTGAAPSWCTPRDYSCPTYGPAVGRVAAQLGRPFLPWQQYVADVMGEVEPDGRFRYPIVDLLVPRRGGKTILTLATSIHRASLGRRRRCWYTSQTGTDASYTFVNDWLPLVDDSTLARRVVKRLSNGSQALRLSSTGSTVGVFPPTRLGLHGKDADFVAADEAWAHSRERGADVEAGYRPAQATRRQRQALTLSAAGDASSTYLLDIRDRGRQLVDEGRCRDAGICYVEYSPPHVKDAEGRYVLDPAVDLDDPALWPTVHPAVGFTIDVDFLRTERAAAKTPEAFYRPYLGVFSSTSELAGAIPAADWAACQDSTAEAGGQVRIGYDVAVDESWAAVAVASRDAAGRVVVELADYRRGSDWVADRVMAMRLRHRASVHALRGGPADAVTAELRRRGLDVAELIGTEASTACAALLSDVRAGRLAHRGQPALNTAAAGAAKAERGDGWVFTRKRSSTDISPLVAATAAAAAARKATTAAPVYREAAS